MAAGTVVTLTGAKAVYKINDTNTSLPLKDRLTDPKRFSILVGTAVQPRTYGDLSFALKALADLFNLKERTP